MEENVYNNEDIKQREESFQVQQHVVCLQVKFGHGEWVVGSVYYSRKDDIPLAIIIPAVIIPMLLFIAVSVYCYRLEEYEVK